MDFLMILAGLVLLFFGGEALLRGAVALAERFGLSKFLVSAVIVGFGTSMPELVVSVGAALKGAPDIALGNIVGSNIANILLIVGFAAVLCPMLVAVKDVKRDVYLMIGASVLLCVTTFVGVLNFWIGILMMMALLANVAWAYHLDRSTAKKALKVRKEAGHAEPEVHHDMHPALAALYCAGGLALLALGADWLVDGASNVARGFGIADAVIGLTVVAVGTSLPELATAVVAAYRKHGEMIVGNIVGSNIFNILSILGITAMITPIPFVGQIARVDVWLMLMVALAYGGLLLAGAKVGRVAGVVMLVAYAVYNVWLYVGAA